ncbi:hypothetical protein LX36DRAFT_649281 [Colletotrichum falcatum]|nr:hypothetical protein LX36DRAFT_649281 [Colletotrichum falcatum]
MGEDLPYMYETKSTRVPPREQTKHRVPRRSLPTYTWNGHVRRLVKQATTDKGEERERYLSNPMAVANEKGG